MRKLRHTDFVICTGSQRTSLIVQKNPRPPDLSSHIQSYLSHVMIFQNITFNLILSLLNPRYFSLQWQVRCSGECQTDWSYVFTLTSAWTPTPIQLPRSPLWGFPIFAFRAGVLRTPGCALFCAETHSAGLGETAPSLGNWALGSFYIVLEIMTIKTNKYFSGTHGNDSGNL